MLKLSRRQLAAWAAEELINKRPARFIAERLAASLIVSRRVNQLDLLISDISWELERRGKVANAKVTSAHELTDVLRRELKLAVKKAVKVDETVLDEQLDEALIGGLRIDTATRSWDKTVARKLTEIREAF